MTQGSYSDELRSGTVSKIYLQCAKLCHHRQTVHNIKLDILSDVWIHIISKEGCCVSAAFADRSQHTEEIGTSAWPLLKPPHVYTTQQHLSEKLRIFQLEVLRAGPLKKAEK